MITLQAHANTNGINLWGPLIWILLSEVPRMVAQNEWESGNAWPGWLPHRIGNDGEAGHLRPDAASFFMRLRNSWIKTPETRQQANPIHSQSTSLCRPPSRTTRTLRRLITAVRKVFTFIPQSRADERISDDGRLAMGKSSLSWENRRLRLGVKSTAMRGAYEKMSWIGSWC